MGFSLCPTSGPRESPVDLSVPIQSIIKSSFLVCSSDKYLKTRFENLDKAKGEDESI